MSEERQRTGSSGEDEPVKGSGGGIRPHDLWVMSPTSCHCSTPRCVLRS